MIKRTDIWFWPLVIAVLSAAGLLSALLADGVWDWVSVLTLGAVSATALYFSLRRSRPRRA